MPKPLECSSRTSLYDRFIPSANMMSKRLKNQISPDQEFTQKLFEELIGQVATELTLSVTPVWNGQSRELDLTVLVSVSKELRIEDAAGSVFLISIKVDIEGKYYVAAKFAQSDAYPIFPDKRGLSFV